MIVNEHNEKSIGYFQYIPNEVVLKILSYLKGKDFAAACNTCSCFNNMGRSKPLFSQTIEILGLKIKTEDNVKIKVGECIKGLKVTTENADTALKGRKGEIWFNLDLASLLMTEKQKENRQGLFCEGMGAIVKLHQLGLVTFSKFSRFQNYASQTQEINGTYLVQIAERYAASNEHSTAIGFVYNCEDISIKKRIAEIVVKDLAQKQLNQKATLMLRSVEKHFNSHLSQEETTKFMEHLRSLL